MGSQSEMQCKVHQKWSDLLAPPHQIPAFGYQQNLFVNLTTTQSSTDRVTKISTFLSTQSISFRNYSILSSRRILSYRVKTPATLALFDEELNILTVMIKSEVHCRCVTT